MLPGSPDDSPQVGSGGGPQACYRHPERETGVSCGRCGRPLCPDCMTGAAVGFQCPECVREAGAQGRPATGRFGGRPVRPGRPGRAVAPVTAVLAGLNVLVFLLTEYLAPAWQLRLGLYSYVPAPGVSIGVAAGPEQWYRLLTSAFVHAGFAHLATNLVSLLVLGPPLERALGRVRFLGLYLLSGLAGNALAFLVDGGSLYSVGASGAIFGLLGATVVLVRYDRAPLGPVVALLVFNLVVTFSVRWIDWRAHIGGLVAGAVMAAGLVYAPREHRRLVQGLTAAAVLALVLGTMLLGMARLGA
ncbi:rhomboid family intramembrane serine protease [Kitasatospora sp. NPDC049258]|uniref:rhomboid family intramembrane serine protease n=1 Tax=Kitasatospora sp. NPDC049258 TaxID=3155394 RepID=UPI003423D40F